MSLAQRIATAFGSPKKTSTGYLCKCPMHDDSTASLGIADKGDDDVILNCLAGCDWKDIKEHAKSLGLLKVQDKPQKQYQQPSFTFYNYADESGQVVAQKVRKHPKAFIINRIVDGQPAPGLQGFQPPLYNLPNIINSEHIYITEGEKDADTLIKAGLPATTNIAGASHWNTDHNKYFKDKTVIICQDNDAAGRDRTSKLVYNLKPIVKELRLFDPPNVRDKGDVTDWVDNGNDARQVFELSKVLHVNNKASKPKLFNAKDWVQSEVVPFDPLLPGLFDMADKVVIIGQSKTRKSFFTLQLAMCLASGVDFLNFPALNTRKVLLIQFEIKRDRFQLRCQKMAQGLDIIERESLINLNIINARGYGDKIEDIKELIADCVKEVSPEVIIFDPLYKLIGGDESKIEEIKPILKFFDNLAETSNAAVIYVHHDKKGYSGDSLITDRGAGSGILARDYDAAIYLSIHARESDTLVVEYMTRNYAPVPAISVKWQDNKFHVSDASTEKQTAKTVATKKAKNSDYFEKAKEFIKKESPFVDSMGMHEFNSKLEDLGMPLRALAPVKELLIKEGLIVTEKRKAIKGESPFIVHFVNNLDKTEFESGLEEFSETPF